MNNKFDHSFHDHYMSTDYVCPDLNITLNINFNNPILDEILKSKSLITAAFITAWNPQSKIISHDENIKLNTELKNELSNYLIFDGYGIGKDGHREDSFLVLGISLEEAQKLQIRFNQKAFVFYEINDNAKLID